MRISNIYVAIVPWMIQKLLLYEPSYFVKNKKECRWFFNFFDWTVVPSHVYTQLSRRFCTKANIFPDTFILRNNKYMSTNRLYHGVGAAGECISQFIHPSKPVSYNYLNMPKGHKVLGLILVGQEMKVIRLGTEPVEVFTFWHKDMPNKVLYAAKRYVHVTVEVTP